MATRWLATDFGGPEVLKQAPFELGPPEAGKVTIEVRAAGLNPADYKHFAPGQDPSLLPLMVGYEVSGIIAARSAPTRRSTSRWPLSLTAPVSSPSPPRAGPRLTGRAGSGAPTQRAASSARPSAPGSCGWRRTATSRSRSRRPTMGDAPSAVTALMGTHPYGKLALVA
jgi:alcohol dehydrogenase-like protein